jgi:hypothetical protein
MQQMAAHTATKAESLVAITAEVLLLSLSISHRHIVYGSFRTSNIFIML